jgi:hypothetical protein
MIKTACKQCHDRKVKCDSKTPCSHCIKYKLQCTPQAGGFSRPLGTQCSNSDPRSTGQTAPQPKRPIKWVEKSRTECSKVLKPCVRCRRRRIRCGEQTPCRPCVDSNVNCVRSSSRRERAFSVVGQHTATD